ncbi:wd repeat protein [Holotrichia oblita]|uniref:Wd repeat protein n=1 Tax=Holotrichia oblita TaxID=644536 RepID=A0ACB9SVR3_HOLOL|nr:wd repeat protein [Holotrichia oblita]
MDFGDLLNDTKIKEKLFNLHSNIDEIEKVINTALNKFDYEKLTPIEKVNYDLFNAYALNILCWMYLRTKGQDPNKTDIKGELVRIKNYMLKLKAVQDKDLRPKVDKPAAQRFIKHGISYSDRDRNSPGKKRKFAEIKFIGNGYFLHVYSLKKNVFQKRIYFTDEHIFGIDIHENKILLYGAKYLKIYRFDLSHLVFNEITSYTCFDWILKAKFLNNGRYIVIVTMHNVVTLLDRNLKIIESKECLERCISYCAQVVNTNWNELIILSGTVFSQVLLWWPAKSTEKLSPVISRLTGHKGVIFSIDYNLKLNIICTTSDDRTAKIWALENESLEKELCKENPEINLRHNLIGHTARVFKCKILNDSIITAGEDGIINVWNTQGGIIKKLDVHQGGPVWTLDCDENANAIVSGGGDSGVFLIKLNSNILKSQLNTGADKPSKVLISSNDNLVYLTEDGLLLLYKRKSETVAGICVHDDLKSYGLLEKSPCGSRIALAGYRGTIHLYEVLPNWLNYMYSCQITPEQRIFSMHWLSCKALLICGLKGVLSLWIIQETAMFPLRFWELPQSKERWSTAACFCGTNKVLVGDRRGILYLYTMESSQPVQIIKRAHNYLGISALYCRNGKIISLGRNSTINEYQLDDKVQRLTQISSDKLPFTWLTGLYPIKSQNTTLLTGFSGINFIVYDHIARRTLLEIECGGGHRSWNVRVAEDKLTFTYIKNKRINVIESDLSDIIGTNVIKGYHLNEINALKLIKFDTNSTECFFVSGGEDTVIRVCSKRFDDNLSDFKHLNALKSHLSSIRAIAVLKINEDRYYLFTGGGRAQIILWEVLIDKVGSDVMNCSQKYNHYEKVGGKDKSETRVMDMTAVTVKGDVFLLAGYSDGIVRVFKIYNDEQGTKLVLINHIPVYKSKCIFKIFLLTIERYFILMTMASDGRITFTNITDIFSNINSPSIPLLTSVKAHQSGINSISSLYNPQIDKLICLTGGDDSAIALNAFNINKNSTNIEIQHLTSFCDESYHGAQVSGVYITENYFLTTSIDQKLLVFKWELLDEFRVQCLQEYRSGVCDIQGMECVLFGDSVKVFLYGRGCEIINCKFVDR